MRRKLIQKKWSRKCDIKSKNNQDENNKFIGSLTIAGVYEKHYDKISKHWKDTTQEKYDKDMNNIILPHITNHNSRTVSEYTLKDCEEIIEKIKEDGFNRKGKHSYSESTIRHFKYLLCLIFREAARQGYCDDFLWGTLFAENKTKEELFVELKTKNKKYLTIKEEIKLLSIIMDSPREDGRLVALLLMLSLGVRDAEACGLNFGMIRENYHYTGYYEAIIVQTTKDDRDVFQSGGKTKNAPRRIPIPDLVADLLLERRKIIEEILEHNNDTRDINNIPVCFFNEIGDDVPEFKRLVTRDISEQARKIYRELKLNPKILAYLECEINGENTELEVKESEPTAYLLRRHYATILKSLGLNYSDTRYLMGHLINDSYTERWFYTDEEMFRLHKLLEKRPLLNNRKSNIIYPPQDREIYLSGKKKICLNLEANEKVLISVKAKEKQDKLTINSEKNTDDISITVSKGKQLYEPPYNSTDKKVDVIKKIQDDYNKASV